MLLIALAFAICRPICRTECNAAARNGAAHADGAVNQWLLGIVRDYGWFFDGVRNAMLYCLLLPLRVGMLGVRHAAIWGFVLPPSAVATYFALVITLAGLTLRGSSWRAVVAVLAAGLILYTGFLGLPWPVFILAVALLAGRWPACASVSSHLPASR